MTDQAQAAHSPAPTPHQTAPAKSALSFEGAGALNFASRWLILLGLILAAIMEILDTTIINVALPQMAGNLGATIEEIAWVSTAYILANVVVLPMTAFLTARFGRRDYLTASIVIFTISSFFCGTSHSLGEMIIWRLLQGAAGASLISTAQATLVQVFPPREQSIVQPLFLMAWSSPPPSAPRSAATSPTPSAGTGASLSTSPSVSSPVSWSSPSCATPKPKRPTSLSTGSASACSPSASAASNTSWKKASATTGSPILPSCASASSPSSAWLRSSPGCFPAATPIPSSIYASCATPPSRQASSYSS